MLEKRNFYINGTWVAPKKPSDIEVINPASEKACAVISLGSKDDIENDESFGFKIIHCDEFQTEGTDKIAERIRKRVGDNPLYLSIDIDVLDPAFAPGTGTPEIAGMTTREMVNVLRGLSGLNLVSADVVEVSPAYDHAEVTSLAAATIVYELINLFAKT